MILALAALAGFVVFAIPRLWIRGLVFSVGDSASSRSLVVVTVLAGAAIGAAIVLIFLRRIRHPLSTLGLVFIAAALAIVVTTSFFDELPRLTGHLAPLSTRFFVSALGSLLPAMLLGMGTTLLFAAAVRMRSNVPRAFLAIAATILFAGIVGWLAVTHLLIPAAGIRGGLLITAATAGIIGLLAFVQDSELPRQRRLSIALGFAAIFAIAASILPPWDAKKLAGGSKAMLDSAADERILEMREGRTATVFVKRTGSDLELNVNGRTVANGSLGLETDMLLGALPFVYRPGARSALVVGLDTGITLSVVARHPSLQSIECVEPLREVVEVAPRFASAIAHAGLTDATKDPRVRIHVESAPGHLLHSRNQYDIILLHSQGFAPGRDDPPNQEFVELCRHRLTENGVLAMRIREDSLATRAAPSTGATFLHSFPEVDIWSGAPGDLVLIASAALPISFDGIRQAFSDPATGSVLRQAGIPDAPTLLSRYRFDSQALRPNSHERISGLDLLTPEESALLDRGLRARSLEVLAMPLAARGSNAEALVLLRQAVAANPNDLAIRRNLARLCVRMGAQSLRDQDYAGARKRLEEALEASPQSVDANAGLARLSLTGGNYEEARMWAGQVLKLDPENDHAYVLMGDAYREERRWIEARDAYRKALELFPDNVSATLHLAEALTYTGDPEGAVAKIERARRLGAPLEELQRIRKLVRQDG
jgi:spermidine synthase/Flp pilus assembly protein TadD